MKFRPWLLTLCGLSLALKPSVVTFHPFQLVLDLATAGVTLRQPLIPQQTAATHRGNPQEKRCPILRLGLGRVQ